MGYMPVDYTLKRHNPHRGGKVESCELNLVQKHPFASVWAALSVMINPRSQVEEVLANIKLNRGHGGEFTQLSV